MAALRAQAGGSQARVRGYIIIGKAGKSDWKPMCSGENGGASLRRRREKRARPPEITPKWRAEKASTIGRNGRMKRARQSQNNRPRAPAAARAIIILIVAANHRQPFLEAYAERYNIVRNSRPKASRHRRRKIEGQYRQSSIVGV